MILPLYPHIAHRSSPIPDIERTVSESHPLVRGNRAVVFRMRRRWRPACVIVVEISRRLQRLCELDLVGGENPLIAEIKAAVARAVADQHGLTATQVILASPGAIPRDALNATDRPACWRIFFRRHVDDAEV